MKTNLTISLLFVVILLSSCGKVTQEVAKEEEKPSFDISFSLAVTATQNKEVKAPVGIKDTLYIAVKSFDKKGVGKLLSWGKGLISTKEVVLFEPKTASLNLQVKEKSKVLTYVSKSYDKKGIEVLGVSKSTVSKPVFNSKTMKWNVDSKKIRRGYSYYFVVGFTNQDNYRFMWVSQQEVSTNLSVSLDEITDYKSFLSLLRYLEYRKGDRHYLYDSVFKMVFNQEFFNLLNYTFPDNDVKSFSVKNPTFYFERDLESSLLTFWELIQVDFDEAFHYLKSVDPLILPEDANKNLKETVLLLKKSDSVFD